MSTTQIVPITVEQQAVDVWDWPLQHSTAVQVLNTPKIFEVCLDVPFFTVKEIEVKVIGNDLVIHCENDKYDKELGNISREVHRSYKIPADVDTTTIHSEFDPKGLLKITAKKKKA